MKLVIYCQHVMGIGHLFRTIEICRALPRHEIVLVSGGPPVEVDMPSHVREVRLPELHMGADFQGLYAADRELDLDRIKLRRRERLMALFEIEKPDVFITELYPFGRKAFRFELDPVLEAIRAGRLPACRVISSIRDVLVEKEDQERHETRAVKILNGYFDAVLVHSDPRMFRLEQTFYQLEKLRVPVVYTGFIASAPADRHRDGVRRRLGIAETDALILASAGSGRVGDFLLEAVIRAFENMQGPVDRHLLVFTGPLMNSEQYDGLRRLAGPRVRVERFTSEFSAHLAAADLSVSMGGYNTTMNLLAGRTPALVLPFAQNQEQQIRARRLAKTGAFMLLRMDDLKTGRLASIMQQALQQEGGRAVPIDLNGAAHTAGWLERLNERGPGGRQD